MHPGIGWEKSSGNSWKVQTLGADALIILYEITTGRSLASPLQKMIFKGWLKEK